MLPLEIYLLTFNCGRELVDPRTLGVHFFQAWPKGKGLPDIISVALQEIAPLSDAFRGSSYVEPYIQQIAKTVHVATTNHASSQQAPNYKLLRWCPAGMTAQAVFIKENLVDRIEHILTADVGCGVSNMGNKGAAGVRLVLSPSSSSTSDPTILTFVAAHLYPHEGGCEKRNQDWKAIVQNLVFEPETQKSDHHLTFVEDRMDNPDAEPLLPKSPSSTDKNAASRYATSMFGTPTKNSHLFFAGDLNYRTSDHGPEDNDHLTRYPKPDAQPDTPQHYKTLLQSDQLNRERTAGRTLHHLTEMPIHFPPTYKYAQPKAQADLQETVTDEGDHSDEIWQFAKHRWPSWCDRILFLDEESRSKSTKLQTHKYDCLPVQATSDHRPVALSVTITANENSSSTENGDDTIKSPFEVNANYRSDRNLAIAQEVVVGYAAFLALTNSGRAIVAMVVVGLVASGLFLKVMI